MRLLLASLLSALFAAPLLAQAQAASAPAAASSASAPVAKRVYQLSVDLRPYYLGGLGIGLPAQVAVDPDYDALLSSGRSSDIRRAAAGIEAKPELVKPQTMIALALRLYDVGLRDDAVFWYYAARDRFLTMEAVLDMRSLRLTRVAEAVDSFIEALGAPMDGYAMCDVARHQEREDRAIAWVAAHPYKVLGYGDLPAQSEDRNAALANAVGKLREMSAHNQALLAKPEVQAQLADARRKMQADTRFCWK